ncbi:MAG: multidrug effflux MFS transporter [Burkholderiaceae bacterium]
MSGQTIAPARGATALLLTVTLLIALQPLSTDLYLPSLPGLTRYFDASVASVQWTLTLFILAFGIAQLVAGPLTDRFGRHPVAIGALLLYCAASLACMLAPSLNWLIVGRVLQSIGACTALVCARTIIRDSYTPQEGARMLAKAGSIMALAPPFALLGGFLESAFNWRAAFAVLTLMGLLGLWAVITQIGETNQHRNPRALHVGPLLTNYRAIASHPGFWAYTLAVTASYAGLFAYLSGSSPVLQKVLGLSPPQFGLGFAASTVGYFAGTLLCRRWIGRVGVQRTMQRGALIGLAGGGTLVALALAGVHHWAAILVPQAAYLVAHGCIQPCAQAGSAAHFPKNAGAATALMGFVMMMVATAIGMWMGGSFNGTVYPLALTVGAASVVMCAVVFGLVRRYGALPG